MSLVPPPNQHNGEGLVRLGLGFALIVVFVAVPTIAWPWTVIPGAFLLITGFSGACPVYWVAGFSTRPEDDHKQRPSPPPGVATRGH